MAFRLKFGLDDRSKMPQTLTEKPMSIFSQLLDRVTDPRTHSVSSCLMQAKRLALRLPSNAFRYWVDVESNGYPSTEPVPDYRIVLPDLVCHVVYSYYDDPRKTSFEELPYENLPVELRAKVIPVSVYQTVSDLEDGVRRSKAKGRIKLKNA